MMRAMYTARRRNFHKVVARFACYTEGTQVDSAASSIDDYNTILTLRQC